MQHEGTRFYRVKAVAERYDVSVHTIYRAIRSGQLDAYKIGGAIRIPEQALQTFDAACADAGYDAFVVGDESPEAADHAELHDLAGGGGAMNTTASATVNGVATPFIPATRPLSLSTPVVASVNVTIPLDRDDLAALLFFYCEGDPEFLHQADDADHVRRVIADTAVNIGMCQVDTTLYEIAGLAADDARQELVKFCRRLIAELFPDVPQQTRRPDSRASVTAPTATSRELVTA
ncbi:helix-turn-helix domain-containing protein [Lentzea chajnantorensis]